MGRLFAFGCSFTQYMWPTWANIIAYDQKLEIKNFAVAGMGNVGIMQRVLEADLKYKFTNEDQIMIMWTSWSRQDTVINTHYDGKGSIFNHAKSESWLKENWSVENDIIKNITAINFINKIYGKYITWQGHASQPYTSEIDEHQNAIVKDLAGRYLEDVKFLYKDALPTIEYRKLEQDKLAFNCFIDTHPDVLEHLDIVKNWIYPQIDKEIKHTTIEAFEELQNHVYMMFTKKKIKTFEDAIPMVNGILMRNFPHIMEYMDIQQIFDNIPETLG